MTDHYEMPHARADECPHAGVGKACRPCRDRFERAPITPDERAAMRARYEPGPMGSPERTDVERKASQGLTARVDVPRLLDALDTAEAEVGLQRERLRSRERAAGRLRAEVTRLHAEVARLRAETLRATASPVWDEDTVTEAVASILESDWHGEYTCECKTERCPVVPCPTSTPTFVTSARDALAVVREHLPVRPDREDIYRAWHGTDDPWGGCADRASIERVLDLWPGESRATVQAEALRDAADDRFPRYDIDVWLRARADRLEKGADRG